MVLVVLAVPVEEDKTATIHGSLLGMKMDITVVLVATVVLAEKVEMVVLAVKMQVCLGSLPHKPP